MEEHICHPKGFIALSLVLVLLFVIACPASADQADSTSLAIAGGDNALASGSGAPPLSDAGGPYVSPAGANILFDGSKSSVPGGLSRAVWNFGDGSYGEGLKVAHSYPSKGFYRAILSITDRSGRTSEAGRMVHVYSQTMSVQISVLPRNDDGIYNPGENFSTIELNVTYSDGMPVEKAEVKGVIDGRTIQSIAFFEEGNGIYRYVSDYYILRTDPAYINVYVNVTDSQGNTGKAIKKLRTLYDNSEARIIIHEPSSNKFVAAYGEPISFRVSLFSSAGTVHDGNVYLYDANTDEKHLLTHVGEEYLFEYMVPQDNGKYLNLILYASFSVKGVEYSAVKEIDFDLLPDLNVEVLSPLKVSEESGDAEIELSLFYPAGEPLTKGPLNATLGNASVSLEKNEDRGIFTCRMAYPLLNGENPYLWVNDGSGNGGGAYISVEDGTTALSGSDPRLLPVAVGLAAFAVLSVLLIRGRLTKQRKRRVLVKEYDDLHQKVESLKKIRKNIMHEYYTRKITEQDARKRILDTEKELVLERGNMKSVMQKLGMDLKDMDGREEIIDWVSEKLKAGENMDLIKKGLKDLNIDPVLAEKVRKTLT